MDIGSFTSGFLATGGATGFGAGFADTLATGAAMVCFTWGVALLIGAGLDAAGFTEADPAFGTACDFGAFPALGKGIAETLDTGFAAGLLTGFTAFTTLALATGLACVLTTGFALETGFALLTLVAVFTGDFGFTVTLDLAALAFWAATEGFLAFAATGLALGLAFEALEGLVTVLAFTAVFGAAFLATAPLEDFVFAGAGLVDLVFF